MKKEFSAGTYAQSSTTADNSTSASVEASPMLSAALSVEEGNRLIAEFLGYKKKAFLEGYAGTFYYKGKERFCQIGMMKYHSSWDWLMPVVEAIEMLHWNDRNNQFNPSLEFFLQNEIEFVWNHVVKFLKWYNLNAVPVGSR